MVGKRQRRYPTGGVGGMPRKRVKSMNVRSLILAILFHQDASGYEIKKLSSEGRFSYFVDISFGSIYPTLTRLETERLVTCRAEEQTGRPDRKVYSITPTGRKEFIACLAQPPQPDKFKSEFLLVAMNADLAGADAIALAVRQRIARLEEEVRMLDDVINRCDHAATRWVVRYGMTCMQNDLSFLKNHADSLIALAVAEERPAAAE
jgi:PadR family transcriptional regulator, regulatory protein AphA